nr:unnamed protein product [Callosobruchus analis]
MEFKINMITELLESTDFSSDEEIWIEIHKKCSTSRPKIHGYIDVINRYSEHQFSDDASNGRTASIKVPKLSFFFVEVTMEEEVLFLHMNKF